MVCISAVANFTIVVAIVGADLFVVDVDVDGVAVIAFIAAIVIFAAAVFLVAFVFVAVFLTTVLYVVTVVTPVVVVVVVVVVLGHFCRTKNTLFL